jgi:uncharacterized cupin superfamily protein
VVPEAPLARDENGLEPAADGWFVVNARDARWYHTAELGSACFFEGQNARFDQLGINVNVLQPGQPGAMYHAEDAQEDFLVVAGEAILVAEGQERRLQAWDFVHCPANTKHVIVAAGGRPCVYIAIGARRKGRALVYPVDDVARKHGAGVDTETKTPSEAYARFEDGRFGPYRDGDLPD